MKEHIDDCAREERRYMQIKHSLKTKFFNIRAKRPPTLPLEVHEPIEMIKSFSTPRTYYKRNKEESLAMSMISGGSRVIPTQKERYADEVNHLLEGSVALTKSKNRFRLKGYTSG